MSHPELDAKIRAYEGLLANAQECYRNALRTGVGAHDALVSLDGARTQVDDLKRELRDAKHAPIECSECGAMFDPEEDGWGGFCAYCC